MERQLVFCPFRYYPLSGLQFERGLVLARAPRLAAYPSASPGKHCLFPLSLRRRPDVPRASGPASHGGSGVQFTLTIEKGSDLTGSEYKGFSP